jgi:hypothetical protein
LANGSVYEVVASAAVSSSRSAPSEKTVPLDEAGDASEKVWAILQRRND